MPYTHVILTIKGTINPIYKWEKPKPRSLGWTTWNFHFYLSKLGEYGLFHVVQPNNFSKNTEQINVEMRFQVHLYLASKH